MNAFKRNNYTPILIAVLIVLNIVCLSFLLLGPPKHLEREGIKKEFKIKEGSIGLMKKRLKLNEAQTQSFRKLKKDHRQKSKEIGESIREMRKTMFSSLGDTGFEVELFTDSIAALQKKLDLVTYYHFSDLRKICNENQKPKFDKFIHELARSMTPNHPRNTKALRRKKF